MPYIGHSPTQAGSYIEVDDFGSSFNGSNVAFTLQVGGVNITPNQQNLLVMIDGVLQQPSNAFSVSGSTITFTEAPVSGADLYCLLMGQSASVGQGTIGADELKVSGDGSDGQVLKSDGDGTFTWLSQDDIAAGTLANARTINGVSFNGSANITVTADANTLSNTTLKSTVVSSSLTSVGTLTALTTGAITQNAGTFTIKNASSDSNGLKIYQDSGDASKIYNHYNGTLQLGVGSTTALTIDSSENSTFAGAIIQSMSNPYTKMIDTSSGGDDYGLNNNDSKFSIYNWTDGREELYFGGDGNATFAGAITINTSTSEQLMLKGATSPYLRFYESTTAKAYIQWHSDGYLNLENSEASTNLAVGANGVGIGVTAPKTALEVGGAGGAHVTLSHTPTNASDIADNDLLGQIDFAGYDTDYSGDFIIGARIKAQVDGTWDASGGGNVADAPTELQFITVNSDTSHDIDHATNLNMVIKSDGKVGIGTTAPDVSLDVMSSDNFKNILLSTSKSDDTDQYVGIAMQHETSAEEDICIVSGDSQDGVSILTIGGGQAVYNTFEQIRFYTASTDTTTTGTERMRIKSDGALTLVEKANAIANSLRFQGLETVGDDEAQNYTMDGTCCIVILANHSSEDAALFFMSYASATITKIADPSNEYDTSATDGKSCIYKSSNSATFTIENKRGGARNMGVAQIAVTSAV